MSAFLELSKVLRELGQSIFHALTDFVSQFLLIANLLQKICFVGVKPAEKLFLVTNNIANRKR